MENYYTTAVMITILLVSLIVAPVLCQIPTMIGCTTAMITSFSPCISYITGGGGSGSPTADCCKAFGGLVSSGTDCACSMLSGAVPFSVPINRTMAITLPTFCNNASVPVFRCKASNPIAAAAPIALGPLPHPAPVQIVPPSPPPATATAGLKPLLLPIGAASGPVDGITATILTMLIAQTLSFGSIYF